MRVLRGVVTALAATALVTAGAAPASAGTGASQACNNAHGYQEIPVNNGIVTLGAQLTYAPTNSFNELIICFSNTTPGIPSTATGGAFWVFFGTYGGSTAPHAYVRTYCDDDLGQQTIDLEYAPFSNCPYLNDVGIDIAPAPTTLVAPGCVVSTIATGCLLTTAGITAPLPRVSITVANVTVL